MRSSKPAPSRTRKTEPTVRRCRAPLSCWKSRDSLSAAPRGHVTARAPPRRGSRPAPCARPPPGRAGAERRSERSRGPLRLRSEQLSPSAEQVSQISQISWGQRPPSSFSSSSARSRLRPCPRARPFTFCHLLRESHMKKNAHQNWRKTH
ncbi:uncharacterized protein PS065_014981 [Dugong dugon]